MGGAGSVQAGAINTACLWLGHILCIFAAHKGGCFCVVRVCMSVCVVCCACHCRQRGDKAASFCLHTKGPKSDFTNESQTEHRLVLAKATLRTQGQLKRRTAGSRVGPHVDIICLLELPRRAHTTNRCEVRCGMWHAACGCSIR